MKIRSGAEQAKIKEIDIMQIIMDLKKEHESVFAYQIEDQVFIYRPLGRIEYKNLVENQNFNDLQKEEIVCQACVLWPQGYDFENCEAGIPTTLTKVILKSSYLDSIETRVAVLSHFRQEMFELENQISCIINEAFPQFDIDEIDKWDVVKTARYLSRAEWKLQNLRGLNMNYDPFANAQQQQAPAPVVKTEELDDEPAQTTSKQKLTPEKLAELKAKFPEIQWDNDEIMKKGIDALRVSTDPPAMRAGW